MAEVQTTYASDIPVAFPGMVANGETSNRISRTVEDAAGIPFGRAAFRGVGDHGCTATPAAGAFLGITIADVGVPVLPGGPSNPDSYPQYQSAGLLSRGEIWVTAGANTTDGAPVYVTPAGAFTPTSSGNTAIPAEFDDTVLSGAMVRLRVTK